MTMKNTQPSLPPGFRFHPTDEELILHYLRKKVSSIPLPVSIIAEVDIYKFDPWDLPGQATFGEKEWYFFTPRDRKYPKGARPNRAAGSGYWKATGTDKVIMTSSGGRQNENIGVKKALVFYTGRPPKGNKTNWIMHEYRVTESPCTASATSIARPMKLKGSPMRLDDWVLCRIYKKSNVPSSAATVVSPVIDQEEERFFLQDTKPPPNLTNFTNQNQMNMNTNHLMPQKSSSFSNLLDALDYFLSEPNNQTNNMSCFGPPCSTLNQSLFIMPQDLSIPGSLDTIYESGLKRQRASIDAEMLHPSKKFIGSSCNVVNNGGTQFDIPGQHSMFSHSLLNQQLLLGTNVQFLG